MKSSPRNEGRNSLLNDALQSISQEVYGSHSKDQKEESNTAKSDPSYSRPKPNAHRHRRSSKNDLMDEKRHWILHELTYPSKEEVQPHSFRHKVWLLFEDPTSSRSAYLMSCSIMAMIIISGTSFLIETVPDSPLRATKTFEILEMFFVICFTIEYVCRLCSCPNLKEFILSFLNLIDLLSFLPFYIEIFIPDSASATPILRVVRLTRVFRIMKVSKYVTWIKVFTSAIQQSIRPLSMLLYIMLIGVVLCSTAIYFIEKDVINPQTDEYPFESIPISFWWAIITMTTVGYGDAVPQTPGGKVIGALTSLCGILVLALPITVISSNFNAEMEKMKRVNDTPVESIQTLRKLLTERYRNLVEEKRKKHEQEQNKKSPWKRRKSIAVTKGMVKKLRDKSFSHRHSTMQEKERPQSWNSSMLMKQLNDDNAVEIELNKSEKSEPRSEPLRRLDTEMTENPELMIGRQNSNVGSVSVLLSPEAEQKLSHLFHRGDTALTGLEGVSEDTEELHDNIRPDYEVVPEPSTPSPSSKSSRNKVSPSPPSKIRGMTMSADKAKRRMKLLSTRDMLSHRVDSKREKGDKEQDGDSGPPSLSAAATFDIAPYLTNEDIRGVLACHIVGSLVHLIEKEEKLLKEKINDLIKQQFDYLLSDLSRIFSEIPHFHGLNAQAFQKPSPGKRRFKKNSR